MSRIGKYQIAYVCNEDGVVISATEEFSYMLGKQFGKKVTEEEHHGETENYPKTRKP